MDEVQLALRNRYAEMHPLIFQRSIEKSKSNGELFDLLESLPKQLPVVWDDQEKTWKQTDNLLQALIKDKTKEEEDATS